MLAAVSKGHVFYLSNGKYLYTGMVGNKSMLACSKHCQLSNSGTEIFSRMPSPAWRHRKRPHFMLHKTTHPCLLRAQTSEPT